MRKIESKWTTIVGALALALAVCAAGAPSYADASDAVLQVVAVQVKPGKLDDYLGKVKKLTEMTERLGTQATTRVWRATLAGENTGTVVVGLEFPSLSAFAEGSKKMQADAEWTKLIASLSDMRTIASQSLYEEITP